MTFRSRLIVIISVIAAVLALGCAAVSAEVILLGDSDKDGEVTILDATYIQRALAGLYDYDESFIPAADVNRNGEIDILDVNNIQRWLVDIDTPYFIGKHLYIPTDPTTAVPPSEGPTDPEGWGSEIFRP